MDLFLKAEQYQAARTARAAGIYPYFHPLNSGQDTVTIMEGKRRIMLGSNNYLGLTADPRVREAAVKAIEQYGSGCSGSRFLNGTLDIHLALERDCADFLGKEDGIAFSTGYQSNLAIISAIADRNDIILSDSMNHASLVDGCRLSAAKSYKYRHSDMKDLQRLLARYSENSKGGILVVTDGVFSMEGEICLLPEIVRLAKIYGARILVDDAHALGILGKNGRGTAEYFGLEEEVDLIMNTFSKSLASLGGCVVGPAHVIDYVRHTARPFIFSASIPPAQVAAARKALEILQDEPWRRERLHAIVAKMKALFNETSGLSLHESGNEVVPILPLLTGDRLHTLVAATELYEAGVYVNPVLPPAVPLNNCLLRTSYTATHTDEQLEEAAATIAKVLPMVAARDVESFFKFR